MLRTGGLRLLRVAGSGSTTTSTSSLATSHRRFAQARAQPLDEVRDGAEYTKEPQYPPIQELSFKANQLRKRASWYEHIRELPTVEEKLLALNMPRYYGYKCLMLRDDQFRYDCLPFVQHSTRTVFTGGALPEAVYEPLRERAEQFVATIRDDVQAAIVFETIGYQ